MPASLIVNYKFSTIFLFDVYLIFKLSVNINTQTLQLVL